MAIELLILALYLRALITPVVLLACSVLSVAAALGLTTWVFQDLLGQEGLTFYAPFAAAVLLIALGSDYNVFSVGAIWNEARRRPLDQALSSRSRGPRTPSPPRARSSPPRSPWSRSSRWPRSARSPSP